jgi:hypothetical protein
MRALIVVAAVLGCALAVPFVSVFVILLSFGIAMYVLMAVGLWAIAGPVLVLLYAVLAKFRIMSWQSVQNTTLIWLAALLVHAGFSHGMSLWGDAAGIMGGNNVPYIEAFLAPLKFVAGGFKFKV